MLKKALKLNRKELGLFYKKKSFLKKCDFITLRFARNKRAGTKFAFIVSGPKKSAVPRNLTRRRMSEIVRVRINSFPEGLDAVFFFKMDKTKKAPKFKDLKKDINNVISSFSI